MSAVAVDTSSWDRYRALEAEAASLSGLIASATARLVQVVDEVEREGQWEGHRSVEAWTALKCGTNPGHARQLVASARGLRDLPAVRAAFEAGSITADHVAVMVNRGLTAEHEDQALRLAEVTSVSQLRTALSFLPEPEPEADKPAPEPSVRFGQRANGMWRAVIELFPEDGELLAKALEAARDEVFRDTHPDLEGDPDPREVRKETSWVDGVMRAAHRALDALDPATRTGRSPSDRYQVHLHVHADTGAAHWHLGPSIYDTVRRLVCCDADITAWVEDANHTLGLGRRQRLANRRLRRAIEHRDGGCVVPGCEQRRWLIIHHIWHWEDGGPTDPHNLVAVCGAHHRMIHSGLLSLEGNPEHGELKVFDKWGRQICARAPDPPGQPPHIAARAKGIPHPDTSRAAASTPTGPGSAGNSCRRDGCHSHSTREQVPAEPQPGGEKGPAQNAAPRRARRAARRTSTVAATDLPGGRAVRRERAEPARRRGRGSRRG